jgi:hypothetical protein
VKIRSVVLDLEYADSQVNGQEQPLLYEFTRCSLFDEFVKNSIQRTRDSPLLLIYRVVQKSGKSGEPRLQNCISVESGHFEGLK